MKNNEEEKIRMGVRQFISEERRLPCLDRLKTEQLLALHYVYETGLQNVENEMLLRGLTTPRQRMENKR